MTGRNDATIELFQRTDVAMALAIRYGVPEPSAISRFAAQAIPVVSEAFDRQLDQPDETELAAMVGEVDPDEVVAAVGSFTTGAHELVGSRLVRRLMEDRSTRRRLAWEMTDDSVSSSAVPGLLAAVAWVWAGKRSSEVDEPEPAGLETDGDRPTATGVDRRETVDSGPVDVRVPAPDIVGATLVGSGADGVGPVRHPVDRLPAVLPGSLTQTVERDRSTGPADGLDRLATGEAALLLPTLTQTVRVADRTPNQRVDDRTPSRAEPARRPEVRSGDEPSGELEESTRPPRQRRLSDDPRRGAEQELETDDDVRLGSSALVLGLAVTLALLLVAVVVLWLLDRQGIIDLGLLDSLTN